MFVRSILLRGFDQQMSEKIGEYMSKLGIAFHRETIPLRIECLEEGRPGKLRLHYRQTLASGETKEAFEDCQTILFAIGREACSQQLKLEQIGIQLNKNNGFKVRTREEQSIDVPWLYAIGDCIDEETMPRGQALELTPVAIQAGQFLARRLFSHLSPKVSPTRNTERERERRSFPLPPDELLQCSHDSLHSSGIRSDRIQRRRSVGQIRRRTDRSSFAILVSKEIFASQVFHSEFTPLEWTISQHREHLKSSSYCKLIVQKSNVRHSFIARSLSSSSPCSLLESSDWLSCSRAQCWRDHSRLRRGHATRRHERRFRPNHWYSSHLHGSKSKLCLFLILFLCSIEFDDVNSDEILGSIG